MTAVTSRARALWIVLAVVVAVAVFAGFYAVGSGTASPLVEAAQSTTQSDTSAAAEQSEETPKSEPAESVEEGELSARDTPEFPDLSRRDPTDPTAIGDVNAPVVLIEFADYRCPFCGVFAREMLPDLIAEYVDTGLVRIEWRDTPIFGVESFDAAVAARAAGEQGMFWEYYHALFAYEGSDHQSLPRERLVEIAEDIAIPDIDGFEAALDDDEIAAAVGVDYAESQSVGVYSTPAFLVGRTPILGAQPYEVFEEAIDAELPTQGVTK